MWFFFAALLVGLVLSIFLAPKPKLENAKAAQLSDFQFPRSDEGSPVPRIYGTVRTKGVNTIGQCNFKAVAIKKKVKTGLFSSKKQIIGYKYYTGLDLGVCLGPGVVFRRMWYGDHLIFAGCLYGSGCYNREFIDLPELLGGKDKNGGIKGWIGLYGGCFDQTTDTYLQANLTKPNPDDIVPAYPGIAHMVFEDFWWGNSPSIEAISVEVAYFTNSLELALGRYVMPNGLDANPVEVLYDLFVTGWGNLGVGEARFNKPIWKAAAYQIWLENNGVSVEVANSNTGADIAKHILEQIDAMMFQNPQTGLIEITLMRRDYVIADLPVLGPDDISSLQKFTKKLWADTFNRVRIQYKNRDNLYQDASATADDFGNIRYQGHVRATDIGMPMCYESELAGQLAARSLSNLNVPLYQCDLEMNRVHSDLTPGKVFVLNWPEYGITNMVMRVRKVGLGTRKSGKVTMSVVQDQFSADAVVIGAPVPPTTDGGSYTTSDIVGPQFIELPYWLLIQAGFTVTTGRTQYISFAKKPTAASLDFFTLLDDNLVVDGEVADTEVLVNAPWSFSAQLVDPIAIYDGFATGTLATLHITALTSSSILADGSAALIRSNGQGLFILGGELFGYETKTDNGDGTFNLNNVHRGLLDTRPIAHLAADVLYFFDGQEGFWDTDVAVAAFTAYSLARSAVGRSAEATATKVALTPVGRPTLPLRPDYLTVEGTRTDNQPFPLATAVHLAWRERNRLAAAIALENDATVAPEAGTTYTLRIYNVSTSALVSTLAGLAEAAYILDTTGLAEATYRLELSAVRGGSESLTAAFIQISMVDALLIDGDPVTIDADFVEV